MSELKLPDTPSVDQSRAGILTVTPLVVGHLLRLPEGQEITEARIGDFGNVEFLVKGDGLPALSDVSPTAHVQLIMCVETRPGDVAKGGTQYRTICWWNHQPEKTWVQRDWSYNS